MFANVQGLIDRNSCNSFGKSIGNHGRQSFFCTTTRAGVLRLQIMPQPLRRALKHAQNHGGHILIHRGAYEG
uniref:Uncharacterized protein n=1 Tax=Sphingomonas sp. JE1 TaxID=1628059 RepID=A0A0D5A0G0_9SPHN|nr:hypothetical protein pJE1_219 [Sphingomonas sp. JE1]